MNNAVLLRFTGADVGERARLAGTLQNYVKDAGVLNLFANLDINDTSPQNRNRPSNIHFICSQLRAFNGIPGLREEIDTWLNS